MSFPQSQQLLPNGQFRARRFPGSQQGMARRLDPALRLDLRFAVDGAFVSRRGPLPALTRASTGTFVGSNGLIQSAALNVPRIDFDPTNLSCLGLLIEDQRTNLCPRSEEFSDVSWSKYIGTVTANAGVAPDGTSSADLIYPSSSGNITGQLYRAITGITAGNVVTISFFAKAAGKTICYLSRVTNSSVPDAYFNLSTGAITNVASGMSAQIKQYPNGWWRVSLTSTASAGTQYAWIGSVDSAGAQFNTASGTNGILVWGAQVEVGDFASSYTPTTTTSVTRAADVCSYSGADFASFWRADEGTFVLELRKANRITSALSQVNYISINDGGGINYLQLCQRGQGVTGEVFRSEVSGVSQALFAAAPVRDANTAFRFGAAYRLNDFASAVNGSNCAVDTVGTVPTVNQLSFVTVANALHIRELQYYATRKTNAQVTQLTRLPTTDAALTLDMQFAADATYFSRIGPLPTFTRASSARFVGSNGLIQVASTDVPRLDYNPVTLACRGLLLEEQRTNLNAWSEDLTNASWIKSSTAVTGNASIAPDGNSSADLISETTANAPHYTIFNGSVAITSGITYTLSVFLKKGTGATAPDWINLFFVTTSFGAKGVAFNVSTGAVGATSGGQTATVMQFPNGWWRVSMTATATGSTPQGTLYTSFTNNTNTTLTPTYAGQTTSDVFVWGLQFEVGSFASSYIPTTSAAVTRSADVCSITGAAFTEFYNPVEGSLVFKGSRIGLQASPVPGYLQLDDGTPSERILLYNSAVTEDYLVTDNGSNVVNLSTGASVANNTPFGVAARYRNNDFAVSRSGASPTTLLSGSIPTVTTLRIGNRIGLGIHNGHVQAVQYFNQGKANTQLQTLSTP